MFFYLLLITTWLSGGVFAWDLTKDGNLFCGVARDTFCTNFTFLPSGIPPWKAVDRPIVRTARYYAYYNAEGRPAGDQTAFITPAIETGGAPACVSFLYYMSGADLGSLYVTMKYSKAGFNTFQMINENKTVSTNDVLEKLIARGAVGESWVPKKFQIALKNQTDVQLFFTAMRGNGDDSNIAVDSLNVSSSIASCPIDGNWGQWSPWKRNGDNEKRSRKCNDPQPKLAGEDCWMKDFTRGSVESEERVGAKKNVNVVAIVLGTLAGGAVLGGGGVALYRKYR